MNSALLSEENRPKTLGDTDLIANKIAPSLASIRIGMCHVFIKHTSASLTINEASLSVFFWGMRSPVPNCIVLNWRVLVIFFIYA